MYRPLHFKLETLLEICHPLQSCIYSTQSVQGVCRRGVGYWERAPTTTLILLCQTQGCEFRIHFLRIRIQQFSQCRSGSSCFLNTDLDPTVTTFTLKTSIPKEFVQFTLKFSQKCTIIMQFHCIFSSFLFFIPS